MQRDGVPPQVIDDLIRQNNTVELFDPDEVESAAIRLFGRIQRLWHKNPVSGIAEYLDPQGIVTVASIIGVDLTDDVFMAIQVMEDEVANEISERARNSRP